MKLKILTFDANIFIAALKADEEYSRKCADILKKIPDNFVLAEPSIIYQEVCGILARKVDLEVAERAKKFLDTILHPELIFECNCNFCKSAFHLCGKYNIYSIDALYLKVALDMHSILVSLDYKNFIERVKRRNPPIEVYHVSRFPY